MYGKIVIHLSEVVPGENELIGHECWNNKPCRKADEKDVTACVIYAKCRRDRRRMNKHPPCHRNEVPRKKGLSKNPPREEMRSRHSSAGDLRHGCRCVEIAVRRMRRGR
jgi:hypothetical protein